MKPEQERLQNLLCETITMLCRNGLSYRSELRVQGLVAVTVDDSDVLIVHLNERVEDAVGGFVISVDGNGHGLAEEPRPNPCSSTSRSDPAQDVVNSTIDQSDRAGAVSPGASMQPDVNDEFRIMKVEPSPDDVEEEDVDAVDFLAKEESIDIDGEVDGHAFKVGVACSSGQNVSDAISFGSLCESDSNGLEVSQMDLTSDAKAAIALVSTSVRSCVPDPVRIRNGNAHQPGQMFQNASPNIGNTDPGVISLTDDTSHAKIPLPKLMRGYLPILPGFTGRQQVITKSERSLLFLSQRQASRLPRRPRESNEKHFVCPFCGLSYYYKKHLKFHLRQKHGF